MKIGLACTLLLAVALVISWNLGLLPIGRSSTPAGVEARILTAEDQAA